MQIKFAKGGRVAEYMKIQQNEQFVIFPSKMHSLKKIYKSISYSCRGESLI